MYVDFLLPDSKIIVENYGPTHFIKPKEEKFNLNTKFKAMTLKKLGYKIIEIPFNTVTASGISVDSFFLEKMTEALK